MRIKTSLYIDENIDARIDERAKRKSLSKSSIIVQDFDRFFLCIDNGRKEYEAVIDNEMKRQIMLSCSQLSGSSSKANFLLTGEMHTIKDRRIIEVVKKLSLIARLALLDDSEN